MSWPDADGGEPLRENDRVRNDVLDAAPREEQVGELLEGGTAVGNYLERALVGRDLVGRLHEHAAGDALEIERAAVLAHELAADERVSGHREDLEVPAIAQNGQRFVLVARRDDRLVKGPLHGLGELASDDSVRADDAAKCRYRVAHERAAVRLGDLVVRRDPARVLMLDDPNGRLGKIRGDAPGRVDVEHVVEARRLPVQLLHRGHRAVLAAERVERGVLVRVLAVAQVADLAER